MSKEDSQNLDNIRIFKKISLEKGLIRKIQVDYAAVGAASN